MKTETTYWKHYPAALPTAIEGTADVGEHLGRRILLGEGGL